MGANQYTSLDKIVLYLQGEEDKLSPKQLEFYNRLDKTDNLIRLYGPGKKTMEMVMNDLQVSATTAWRLIQAAQRAFGSTSRASKEYWKGVVLEKLSVAMTKALEIVEGGGYDLKELKVIADLAAEIRRTVRYDQEDPDLPQWGDMGPNEFKITFDPRLVGGEELDNLDELITKYTSGSPQLPNPKDVEDVDSE